jgi:hypothetical protein
VLLKEAGVSASKGPTATCEYPAFAFICAGCTLSLVGCVCHRRRWSRWRACRTDRLCCFWAAPACVLCSDWVRRRGWSVGHGGGVTVRRPTHAEGPT